MKAIILGIGIYFFATLAQAQAQQITSGLNKYPKSILIKIYEVSQKVTLTPEKQRVMAEIYFNMENELAEAILDKASRKNIDEIKVKYESALRGSLTADELSKLNKTEYKNDGTLHNTTSKFYAAYKYAGELKLTKNQVDSVLTNGIRFEQAWAGFIGKTPGERFDAQGYENRVLPKILSETQFNFLFTIKFKEAATSQAITDWGEAKKRGLTSRLDSAVVVPEMIRYTAERKAIGERFKNDADKRGALYAALDESSPELLKKLKYARQYGNPLNDKGNVSKSAY